MKLTKWMAATALFLSFGVAGCTDDITDEVSQLTRNTDEVSVAYCASGEGCCGHSGLPAASGSGQLCHACERT